MEQLPPRHNTIKIVLLTVLACSFIPGLHRLGPYLLHTSASRIEQTARLADRLSGYPARHPEYPRYSADN